MLYLKLKIAKTKSIMKNILLSTIISMFIACAPKKQATKPVKSPNYKDGYFWYKPRGSAQIVDHENSLTTGNHVDYKFILRGDTLIIIRPLLTAGSDFKYVKFDNITHSGVYERKK